jgi:hypothetical protein
LLVKAWAHCRTDAANLSAAALLQKSKLDHYLEARLVDMLKMVRAEIRTAAKDAA